MIVLQDVLNPDFSRRDGFIGDDKDLGVEILFEPHEMRALPVEEIHGHLRG